MSLPAGISKLKKVRIAIPKHLGCTSHPTKEMFEFLPKNHGLTEQFIYNNTNPTEEQLPVYSASYAPIGYFVVSQSN